MINTAHRLLLVISLAGVLPMAAGCKKKETKTEPAPAGSAEPAPPADAPAAVAETKPAEPAPPAGPTVGACTVKEDKSCSETKLNNPGDSATYGKQCADILKGAWADGPCPMENVIGECNSASAGRTVYYKGAKDTKHTCEQMVMGGVYTAAAK
ncbi:MAG: hypothetical protein WKG01_03255 [Kofleriaceae bacterium]